jgi:YD repeat-containing protein
VYEHDARQDIVAVRDALGQITRTPFDANGHPKGSTDALGRSSSTVFDARGVMSAVRISFFAEFQPRFSKFQLLGAGF